MYKLYARRDRASQGCTHASLCAPTAVRLRDAPARGTGHTATTVSYTTCSLFAHRDAAASGGGAVGGAGGGAVAPRGKRKRYADMVAYFVIVLQHSKRSRGQRSHRLVPPHTRTSLFVLVTHTAAPPCPHAAHVKPKSRVRVPPNPCPSIERILLCRTVKTAIPPHCRMAKDVHVL